MKTEQCNLDNLLSTNTSVIQYCSDCGVVHLLLSGITLRLSTEYFQTLSQDLRIGSTKLHARTLSPEVHYKNNITNLHK